MLREKISNKFEIFIRELLELKKNRIKTLLLLLLSIAVLPLALAILISIFDSRENIILVLPKMVEADYYSIQIDDDIHFLSPNAEKRISKEKSKIVLSLEKRNNPYYWRYRTINKDGSEGEWQDQLELKGVVPKEDIFFFMEGNDFEVDKPIDFYIFVRNTGEIQKDFSYNISVRSDLEENGKLDTEVEDILFGKISVGSNSDKLEKVTMRTGENLQIDRKFYAIAILGDYKSIVNFSIKPSYTAYSNTRGLERGIDNKVGLMVTNPTNEVIKSIKVNMSTSSNLKISEAWSGREIVDLGPRMTEFLQWDVDVLEVGETEISFDILSGGGVHNIQKKINLHHNVSLRADLPNRNIAINKPAELKVKIANPSESPVTAKLELVLINPVGVGEGSIKAEEKTKVIEIGAGSEECASGFLEKCSREAVWNVVGNRFGAYEYYIKSNDSKMEIVSEPSRFGLIHVAQDESSLDLTIESNDIELEKRTGSRREAVNFDIKLNNYSKSSDVVKIQVIPTGTGWHAYMHDGKDLKNNSEFVVDINPDSSKTFRLILSPYDKAYEGSKFVFSNPLKVEVIATSNNNHANNDKVYASAFLEE